ncbi:lipoyl synthase [bacterium]|nr:lipoyl synthase [bacterium]
MVNGARRMPRIRIPAGGAADRTRALLASLNVHTVCQEAQCPNRWECFGRGTATFMILGSVCTRGCRFCAVQPGVPGPVDDGEPRRVAESAAKLGLKYVVVTSVTRDDLPDGGAHQFVRTIEEIRRLLPDAGIEVLTPDFQGDVRAIEAVLRAKPSVFNHNIETIKRLTPQLRSKASYLRSLAVLGYAYRFAPDIPTKSGIMVGIGESPDEVRATMADLRACGCRILTIGQYLAPSKEHYPVNEYVSDGQFAGYQKWAEEMGFDGVASGPLVRSSYHAELVAGRRRVGSGPELLVDTVRVIRP